MLGYMWQMQERSAAQIIDLTAFVLHYGSQVLVNKNTYNPVRDIE